MEPSDQVKAGLRNAQTGKSHLEASDASGEIRTHAGMQPSRSSLRPAPLKLEGTEYDEQQPRIGRVTPSADSRQNQLTYVSPLPPTPENPSVRKRKAAAMPVESSPPYYQKKKRVTLKLRSSTTAAAPRVAANRRIGVDDLAITMNDQGGNMADKIPFPFLKLPGGMCFPLLL